jgi:predicted N-acetyltransferase YhbS
MDMDFEISRRSDLTQDERDFLDGWIAQTFVGGDKGIKEWASSEWVVMVREDGQIVCLVEIVGRRIQVADRPLQVGGIANLVTRNGWRRRGLASAVMYRAMDFIRDELEADFGLLVCEKALIPFYERLGWHLVADPVFVEQSQGRIVLPHTTMVFSCGDAAVKWPSGTIDLCGLPW